MQISFRHDLIIFFFIFATIFLLGQLPGVKALIGNSRFDIAIFTLISKNRGFITLKLVPDIFEARFHKAWIMPNLHLSEIMTFNYNRGTRVWNYTVSSYRVETALGK